MTQVFVKTLTGRCITANVELNQSVKDLKQLIY